MPATKTANVNARIDLSVKTQAERILSQLGLPRSVAIDAFYRQIIIHGGIPFSLNVSKSKVPSYDEMTQSEFNQMLATSIAQIKRGETVSMDEVFEKIEADWEKQMDQYHIDFTLQAEEHLNGIYSYSKNELSSHAAARPLLH